jgi:hypothetical protein
VQLLIKNTYVIFTGSGQSGLMVGNLTLDVRQRPVSS